MSEINFLINTTPSGTQVMGHIEAIFNERRKHDPKVPRNRHVTIEARSGDTLIGGAYLIRYLKVLSIESFWVAADNRRQGLGSQLFRQVENVALEFECEAIVGTVSNHEVQALDFWRSVGGVIFAKLDGFADGTEIYYVKGRPRLLP